ncbi:MAG: hypothetical protein ABRQ27_06480 [Clostridiaceae bacterium]
MVSIVVLLVLSLGFVISCSNNKAASTLTNKEAVNTTNNEQDIREVAYNQLNSQDKEKIAGGWKESKLSKIILKEGMGNILDKTYIGKEVYLIDFPTQSKSLPNNIIVYLSIDNNKLLGYGYVE